MASSSSSTTSGASLEPLTRAAAVGDAEEFLVDTAAVEDGEELQQRLRLPPWARPARVALLLLTDTAAVSLACSLAVFLWAVVARNQVAATYTRLFPLVGVFPVAYAIAGMYPGFGLGAVENLRRLSMRTSFVFLFFIATAFVLRVEDQYSRLTLLLAWPLVLLAVPLARLALLSSMHRTEWWTEPAVVIGTGPIAERTIHSLSRALTMGYQPRCVLSLAPGAPESVGGVPVVGSLSAIHRIPQQHRHVALLAQEDNPSDQLLEELQDVFRHVILVTSTVSVEGVRVRNLGEVLGIEFQNQLLLPWSRVVKRTMDVVLGSLGLVVALPIIGLCALLIKISDPGPAFFRQKREGRNGKWIDVWKLRTMVPDAEERLQAHLASHPEARREWEQRFKLQKDPRVVLHVGSWMRRFSIDELPQLWAVVKGDMSLIGPRPFPHYHLQRLSPEARRLRRKVRPGLTGLWQVMVGSRSGLPEQETYDTYYIRNWSVWIDLYLLAKTVLTVLRGKSEPIEDIVDGRAR